MPDPATGSREQEDRERFISEVVWPRIHYWAEVPNQTVQERLSGLMHSILAEIDGVGGGPAWALHRIESDEETGAEVGRGPDIAGGLHEILYPERP